MRRIAWPLLVISSGLALVAAAAAAVRPHYGGTVRVMVREAPAALDPASLAAGQDDHILPLIFEGLTGFDGLGRLQPRLASRWQGDSTYQHWQFWLRNGVSFQDGSPLTADAVAGSLRAANPAWKVTAAGDSVIIETETAAPALPAELALPRNAIVRRNGDRLAGTGPFRITAWQPGRKLVLSAYDDYWRGRPFADALDITLGQSWRQQMIALELGRADVVEVAPQQARRAVVDGKKIFASAPNELIAVVFARSPQSQDEARLRQALSASIDRASLAGVLLQGQGKEANSILPEWMTGYAFLFDQKQRPQPSPVTQPSSTVTLSYDPSDPTAQLIAQRVALNARDAGINVQPTTATGNADARLTFIPLASPDARVALASVAAAAGLAPPQFQGTSPEELYGRERELLQSSRIIPLAHVPDATAVSPAVNGWRQDQFGAWRLGEVWLEVAKP